MKQQAVGSKSNLKKQFKDENISKYNNYSKYKFQ